MSLISRLFKEAFKKEDVILWKYRPMPDTTAYELAIISGSYFSTTGHPIGMVLLSFEDAMTPSQYYFRCYGSHNMGRHFLKDRVQSCLVKNRRGITVWM